MSNYTSRIPQRRYHLFVIKLSDVTALAVAFLGFSLSLFAIGDGALLDITRGLGVGEVAWSYFEERKEGRFDHLSYWLKFPPPLMQFVNHLGYSTSIDVFVLNRLLSIFSMFIIGGISYVLLRQHCNRITATVFLCLFFSNKLVLDCFAASGSSLNSLALVAISAFMVLKKSEVNYFSALLSGLLITIASMARMEAILFILPLAFVVFWGKRSPIITILFLLSSSAYYITSEHLAHFFVTNHYNYGSYASSYSVTISWSVYRRLFVEGVLSGYTPIFAILFALAAVGPVFFSKSRTVFAFTFVSYILVSVPLVVMVANGSILPTRPYYFLVATPFLIALISIILTFYIEAVNSKKSILILLLLMPLSTLLAANFSYHRNYDTEFYKQSNEVLLFLKSKSVKSESIFFGNTFYWSAYHLLHTYNDYKKVYTYISHCCVTKGGDDYLQAQNLSWITRDDSHTLTTLEYPDKVKARIIWGHNFIEQFDPLFVVVLSDKYHRVWKIKQQKQGALGGYFFEYTTQEDGVLHFSSPYVPTTRYYRLVFQSDVYQVFQRKRVSSSPSSRRR